MPPNARAAGFCGLRSFVTTRRRDGVAPEAATSDQDRQNRPSSPLLCACGEGLP
jgi:hypothetical protein